jgi:hypothetical protein
MDKLDQIEVSPRSIEQILSREEIETIEESTKRGRVYGFLDRAPETFAQEMESEGSADGDYQGKKFYWGKDAEISLIDELRLHLDSLFKRGVPCVNVVDFGAGGAKTLLLLAQKSPGLIRAGKLRLIATNLISSAPTLEDIQEMERIAREEFSQPVIKEDHIRLLEENIQSRGVEFIRADALELFDHLKGKPVHLMFMFSTPSRTAKANKGILKLTSKMLDPKFGSVLIDSAGTQYGIDQTFYEGLSNFKQKGFETVEGPRNPDILVYAAPECPRFDFNPSSMKTNALEDLDRPPSLHQRLRARLFRRFPKT